MCVFVGVCSSCAVELVECSASAGCTPRSLGCGVDGPAVDCTRVGITGTLAAIDLGAASDPAPQTLILEHNTITGLGGNFVKYGASLTSLIASNNAVATVDKDALANLPALKEAGFSNNLLPALAPTLLANNPQVRVADFSNNRLTPSGVPASLFAAPINVTTM